VILISPGRRNPQERDISWAFSPATVTRTGDDTSVRVPCRRVINWHRRGLDATLDDVARHAGVGVGTVYRRFPDKDALVEELFTERIDALVRDTEKASRRPVRGPG